MDKGSANKEPEWNDLFGTVVDGVYGRIMHKFL